MLSNIVITTVYSLSDPSFNDGCTESAVEKTASMACYTGIHFFAGLTKNVLSKIKACRAKHAENFSPHPHGFIYIFCSSLKHTVDKVKGLVITGPSTFIWDWGSAIPEFLFSIFQILGVKTKLHIEN